MRKIIKRKEPTPLLIVLASFDPSCEGVDHFDPEKPELLTDINKRCAERKMRALTVAVMQMHM